MRTAQINWISACISCVLLVAHLAIGWKLVSTDRRDSENIIREALFKSAAAVGVSINTKLSERATIAAALATAIDLQLVLTPENYDFIAGRLKGDRDDIVNIATAPDLVVRYVYPFENNASVIGLDYNQRPDFLPGVMTALNARAPVLTGPIDLVQGGSGMILRVPVFGDAEKGESDVAWGLVSIVLDQEKFFDNIDADLLAGDVDLAIRRPANGSDPGQIIYGDPSVFESAPIVLPFSALDLGWEIALMPEVGWPNAGRYENTIWTFVLLAAAVSIIVSHLLVKLSFKSTRARQQLLGAIQAIDDGFALYDTDDRLVMCNNKYKELYSTSADAMVPGRSFKEILETGLARGQYREAIGNEEEWLQERLAAHRSSDAPIEQLLDNGKWLKISERQTSDGGVAGFRVDVTDLKKAREAAEEAERTTTQFLHNINHEMRTPLTVILGFNAFQIAPDRLRSYKDFAAALTDETMSKAELAVASNKVVDEMKTYGKRIQVSAQHLLDLVNDTLDLAKLEHKMLKLRLAPVDLGVVSSDCLAQFTSIAQQKGLILKHTSEDLTIDADAVRIKQILINLIGNAIKFTETGSIHVTCKKAGTDAHIEITDTGSGIEPANLKNLFEQFVQVEAAQSDRVAGTGLGLAICKQLVELHDGRIEVDSVYGVGSTFRVILPMGPSPQSDEVV